MSRFFEGASQQAEIMNQGLWSPEEVASIKGLAVRALEKIKSSPANIVFEWAIAKAYPSLTEDERHGIGDDLYERILALAQQDDPVLTGRISPKELKRFMDIYLAE